MYWKAPLVSLVMAVFVTISSAIPQFLGNYKYGIKCSGSQYQLKTFICCALRNDRYLCHLHIC